MNYRFSGHETFPVRYSWLPKAYQALSANPRLFADEENAMVILGVGKNMVRAIRFWMQAAGIAQTATNNTLQVTPLGQALLALDGHDPFLEDIRTLWLIHWNISTLTEEPLFAWHYLLNYWQQPELSRTKAVKMFAREAEQQERRLSSVTLEQHFDVFLHTYVPTRSRKGEILEDNLDSPLIELNLVEPRGERETEKGGQRETLYAFRRTPKPEIDSGLFLYCLDDFWRKHYQKEETLPFRNITVVPGSPGQIFKLPENDIRERLDTIADDSGGYFQYEESAALARVRRTNPEPHDWLGAIYQNEETHV
ncbi:MAG TPA: DUF4007 family protein [Blastocatellia bacterium]|nr:DUF4007 family protein [Blastocatellia bacterium]HMZ19881.1 DUF4007 family protein [Blastocatellia bacterium]